MAVVRFYPHRTAPDQIRLTLDPASAGIERRQRSLVVTAQAPEEIRVAVRVVVPPSVYSKVLPDDEIKTEAPPVHVALVYRSDSSRKRGLIKLGGDRGVYNYELTLTRGDWFGRVELQAVLVRAKRNDHASAGFAAERGVLLSWSEPWFIDFDPVPPPGEGSGFVIPIWENFEESSDSWRRQHSDNLFAVDLSPEYPVLYLNSRFPKAYEVLNSQAQRGRKARARDLAFYLIAHQVWSSLLGVALVELTELVIGSEDTTPEELLGSLGQWQRQILQDWSQWLFPKDREEAVAELVSAVKNRSIHEVMARLPNAIQERFTTFRPFKELFEEVVEGPNEDAAQQI